MAKEGAIRMGSGTAPAIRPATAADAQRLADIYNQAIAERGATFETTPRTAADMARRLAEAAAEDAGRHPSPPSQPPQQPQLPQLPKPLLVVEHADAVAGWAAISSYSQRRCYAGVGDFSIYLDRAARGRGLGRLLLEALIGEAARLGYWKLVSGIFPFNDASRALRLSRGRDVPEALPSRRQVARRGHRRALDPREPALLTLLARWRSPPLAAARVRSAARLRRPAIDVSFCRCFCRCRSPAAAAPLRTR
jgi:phosphinothricin acetyltransferase